MSRTHHPPGPIWVSAVALVNEAGHILMQQRRAGNEHGGLWEFPGGKLEARESPEAAAVRELAEELTVTLVASDLHPVSFASRNIEAASDARSLVILLFVCTRWDGEPAPHAAQRLAWYDPSELAGLPMPPLDYPLAEGLVRLLKGKAI